MGTREELAQKYEIDFVNPFMETVALAELDKVDHAALADHILDLERRNLGGQEHGYWRTRFLNESENPALLALETQVREVVGIYLERHETGLTPALGEYWAQVYRAGQMYPHIHPLAMVSAVYYPLAGDSASHIKFDRQDRSVLSYVATRFRPKPGPLTRQWFMVKPVTGLLLVFPAWLPHSVQPFCPAHEHDMRISIAFNYIGAGAEASLPWDKYRQGED
jgi:uncharacterized protein (TIGR02466 family)